MNKNIFLILIGTPPPPRGGVTTHIERLLPYLDKTGIEYAVWNPGGGRHPRTISLRRRPDLALLSLFRNWRRQVKVLHCPISHITLDKIVFLLLLKLLGVRLTLTLTASPSQTTGDIPWRQAGLSALARSADAVVTANPEFEGFLRTRGVLEENIYVVPAFIPYPEDGPGEESLPQGTRDFCRIHHPVVTTYAFGPDIHNEQDLYGLDMFVELGRDLLKEHPEAGFVAAIPQITNQTYYDRIIRKIRNLGLNGNFHFAMGNHFPFVPILRMSDVFIRATNTDGDALTLREALAVGVPSVASDVCQRPDGTIVFASRNAAELTECVRQALRTEQCDSGQPVSYSPNNAERFILIFQRVAAQTVMRYRGWFRKWK